MTSSNCNYYQWLRISLMVIVFLVLALWKMTQFADIVLPKSCDPVAQGRIYENSNYY